VAGYAGSRLVDAPLSRPPICRSNRRCAPDSGSRALTVSRPQPRVHGRPGTAPVAHWGLGPGHQRPPTCLDGRQL